ncbi:MAG: KH domain-containing protein [Candidatus Woesearchaeota archaeon]
MDTKKIVEIVKLIVENLVENPDEVKINHREEKKDNFIINVEVSSSDMGKVIGKKGGTANSIRSIVKSLTADQKQNYYVKINKKEG